MQYCPAPVADNEARCQSPDESQGQASTHMKQTECLTAQCPSVQSLSPTQSFYDTMPLAEKQSARRRRLSAHTDTKAHEPELAEFRSVSEMQRDVPFQVRVLVGKTNRRVSTVESELKKLRLDIHSIQKPDLASTAKCVEDVAQLQSSVQASLSRVTKLLYLHDRGLRNIQLQADFRKNAESNRYTYRTKEHLKLKNEVRALSNSVQMLIGRETGSLPSPAFGDSDLLQRRDQCHSRESPRDQSLTNCMQSETNATGRRDETSTGALLRSLRAKAEFAFKDSPYLLESFYEDMLRIIALQVRDTVKDLCGEGESTNSSDCDHDERATSESEAEKEEEEEEEEEEGEEEEDDDQQTQQDSASMQEDETDTGLLSDDTMMM